MLLKINIIYKKLSNFYLYNFNFNFFKILKK